MNAAADSPRTTLARRHDAIIIGAGPAGCTAAILLAQGGWSVALVERQRFPRRKVCGECVAASNLPLLAALGIGEAFDAAAGASLRRVALWTGERSIIAPLPQSPEPRYPWGRALGRERLDTLLLARAAALGVTVWQPWTALGLEGKPGDFRCELRAAAERPGAAEGVMLQAPVAIAANGSWEPLPAERCAQRLRETDLLAFKANFADCALEPDLLPVLSFPGGYGGMVIADGGLATLACCIRADRLRACRQTGTAARAGESVEAYLRAHCRGVERALLGAHRLEGWLAVGPVRPGLRRPARDGAAARPTAFLIGNAAAEAHPIIGEGISMAIQSAWLLCAQLLACPAARERSRAVAAQGSVQRRYTRQWRRQFAGRLRLASCAAHLAMRPRLSAALLPLLERTPALLTACARRSGKVRSIYLPPAIAMASAARQPLQSAKDR